MNLWVKNIFECFVGVSQMKIQMSLNQDTVRLLKKQIEDMVFWETEHNEVSRLKQEQMSVNRVWKQFLL